MNKRKKEKKRKERKKERKEREKRNTIEQGRGRPSHRWTKTKHIKKNIINFNIPSTSKNNL